MTRPRAPCMTVLAVMPVLAVGATAGTGRPITVDDIVGLREIDSLELAPDHRHYAIFVRQRDPRINDYRTAWYVGAAAGGLPIWVGHGGKLQFSTSADGIPTGDLQRKTSRWSPDGKWIAYTLKRDAEVQLWRSRADGSAQEQLTYNAADVEDFEWSGDGARMYFTAGKPRATLYRREARLYSEGYRYDEDVWYLSDFLQPQRRAVPNVPTVWVLSLDERLERLADETERAAFKHAVETRAASLVRAPDDSVRDCREIEPEHLLCVRDTKIRPAQIVALSPSRGAADVVADLNPLFDKIRIGRTERFKWPIPKFAWNEPGGALAGAFADQAHGYILYPPDFNPTAKYPIFIEPYGGVYAGFNASVGHEHPLQAYAASGFVVLNLAFPSFTETLSIRAGPRNVMKQLFSRDLGYPLMSLFMESTLRGLDTVAERGWIDLDRVGIGSVSFGTYIPLYLLQKHDRIAAISISGGPRGPHSYYAPTQKARAVESVSVAQWMPKPEGAGREYWREIDLADHVETIEAPIMMQHAASEAYQAVRLMRHMEEAGLPYDAYVFADEMHVKWQAVHIRTVMHRNFDWFRFWLQGYEDPAPDKLEQYRRWWQLREQQCRNPRALLREGCPYRPTGIEPDRQTSD